jgi:FkbM family methyltransferase
VNRVQLETLKLDGYAPRTLLDIGANAGGFSESFRLAFPDCVPTLIEPNPYCEDELARLPYERHMVAASDENGEADLFLSSAWLKSTGASLYRENSDYFRDELLLQRTVRKARLDDLLAGRRFDFVKIDVQGSELDVLRGGETVLRQADYILIEISVVDFNAGAPPAEQVIAELAMMGFAPVDFTDLHRQADLREGVLQMDVLFQRRTVRPSQFGRLAGLHGVGGVVTHLRRRKVENRDFRVLLIGGGPPGWPEDLCDATLGGAGADFPGDLSDPEAYRAILAHVARNGRFDYAVAPHVAQTLVRPSSLLERLPLVAEAGWITTPSRYLEALKIEGSHRGFAHHRWGVDHLDDALILAPKTPLIEHLTFPGEAAWQQARERFELQVFWRGGLRFALLGGEGALPTGPRGLDLLGRFFEGVPLVQPAPETPNADDTVDVATELAKALATARDPHSGLHPLGRMKYYHDAVSLILCETLTPERLILFEDLLAEALAMDVRAPSAEWVDWVNHYRVVLEALRGANLAGPTPAVADDGPQTFLTGDGQTLDAEGLKAHADALGVETVFFAAADERYVELYARWLALSVLKYSDVPFLVVIHVIGGDGRLAQAAAAVRIDDPRLVFTGDAFDASSVTTKCYEAPPKGLIEIPVAHYQSVRFQRLGGLLDLLQRPVFVSDIDMLLQRGVADLLNQWPDADFVINENDRNIQAGSRITANLLLARPTPATAILLRWLRAYLDERLSRETVTRWIDQVALNLARHHLALHVPDATIGTFDTTSDINNVMFSEYMPGHSFRFLSLYHGFDTSTLEE